MSDVHGLTLGEGAAAALSLVKARATGSGVVAAHVDHPAGAMRSGSVALDPPGPGLV